MIKRLKTNISRKNKSSKCLNPGSSGVDHVRGCVRGGPRWAFCRRTRPHVGDRRDVSECKDDDNNNNNDDEIATTCPEAGVPSRDRTINTRSSRPA